MKVSMPLVDLLAYNKPKVVPNHAKLPEYEKNGKKHSYGKRSHYSVLNALRRFQTFLIESKLV